MGQSADDELTTNCNGVCNLEAGDNFKKVVNIPSLEIIQGARSPGPLQPRLASASAVGRCHERVEVPWLLPNPGPRGYL